MSTLMLRLADGSRIRRRFVRADTMGKVFDWADVQGVDLESQKLSSSFPKVRRRDILCARQKGSGRGAHIHICFCSRSCCQGQSA